MGARGDGRERSVKETLAARYGSQSAAASDLIVLRGQSGVTVYGCRSILLYTPREMRICLGKRSVSIRGKGLRCTSFSAGAVNVKGEILAILLCEGSEDLPFPWEREGDTRP